MTGEEYRAAIKRLGLSQVQAAKFLGVDATTSRRWIADKHGIPEAVAMLLRVMIRHKLTRGHVERLEPLPWEQQAA